MSYILFPCWQNLSCLINLKLLSIQVSEVLMFMHIPQILLSDTAISINAVG